MRNHGTSQLEGAIWMLKIRSGFLIGGFSRDFRAFLPILGRDKLLLESNHAGVSLQNLREILRKCRARHHDVCAGFLGLLLEFTLHMR